VRDSTKSLPPDFDLSSYDYFLPESDIAQQPAQARDAARLLVIQPNGPPGAPRAMSHVMFRSLPKFLRPGDCLVLNDTKVLPARIHGIKSRGGGEVEFLLVRPLEEICWAALARPARRLHPGDRVILVEPQRWDEVARLSPGERFLSVCDRVEGSLLRLMLPGGRWGEAMERYGQIPFPPYVHNREASPGRYQTVYARQPGSVAAPTAGLHFTADLMRELASIGIGLHYVTLHVGPGTFLPVRDRDVRRHRMHAEHYRVERRTMRALKRCRETGGRIIAVGTTSVRVLETLGALDVEESAVEGWTSLFIYPGFQFRLVDGLITNFHLPRSTLLMLVAALAGRHQILAAYREARRHAYRMYSFGDAMFILPREGIVGEAR